MFKEKAMMIWTSWTCRHFEWFSEILLSLQAVLLVKRRALNGYINHGDMYDHVSRHHGQEEMHVHLEVIARMFVPFLALT